MTVLCQYALDVIGLARASGGGSQLSMDGWMVGIVRLLFLTEISLAS